MFFNSFRIINVEVISVNNVERMEKNMQILKNKKFDDVAKEFYDWTVRTIRNEGFKFEI